MLQILYCFVGEQLNFYLLISVLFSLSLPISLFSSRCFYSSISSKYLFLSLLSLSKICIIHFQDYVNNYKCILYLIQVYHFILKFLILFNQQFIFKVMKSIAPGIRVLFCFPFFFLFCWDDAFVMILLGWVG